MTQATEREEGELTPAAPDAKPAETPQQAKRRLKIEEARKAEVQSGALALCAANRLVSPFAGSPPCVKPQPAVDQESNSALGKFSPFVLDCKAWVAGAADLRCM